MKQKFDFTLKRGEQFLLLFLLALLLLSGTVTHIREGQAKVRQENNLTQIP